MKPAILKLHALFLTVLFLLPASSHAATIVNHDFNNNTFGPLYHGSYWSIQPTGGVGNTPVARLEYSVAGNPNKALGIGVSSYASNQYWIEMDVKITGTVTGGSKFLKLFGHAPTTDAWGNNMTLGMEYSSNVNSRVAYYGDTICADPWSGPATYGDCGSQWVKTGSSIDMRGGSWGHYKAWVKRASPGSRNGEVKVWWNGVLRAHITNMDSNPGGSSPYFKAIEFGGYNHASAFSGATWYLWMDNIYIGTTEKSGGSTTPPPTDPPTTPPTTPPSTTDTTAPKVPSGVRLQ